MPQEYHSYTLLCGDEIQVTERRPVPGFDISLRIWAGRPEGGMIELFIEGHTEALLKLGAAMWRLAAAKRKITKEQAEAKGLPVEVGA